MENKKIKVMSIGGGNGSAFTLNALKQYKDIADISAVVSVTDSTGSSRVLRDEFDTLPVGDIMRAVLALSPYNYKILKNIFYKNRFDNLGKLSKHNLGNLALVLMQDYAGDFVSAIRALECSIEARGKVWPVSLGRADLVAELEDGQKIISEGEIDKPKYDKNIKIKKLTLDKKIKILPEVKELLEQADYIFFGPGSFYTSIIATILPDGFFEALQNSKAKFVFVFGNARHTHGETGPKQLSEFITTLEGYLPRKIDLCYYNNHEFDDVERKIYNKRGWEIVPNDSNDSRIIAFDYEREGTGLSWQKFYPELKKLFEK